MGADYVLENDFTRAFKLAKNVVPDKHKNSDYCSGFDAPLGFVASFCVIIISYWYEFIVTYWYKRKYILILGKGPTESLHGTTLSADK